MTAGSHRRRLARLQPLLPLGVAPGGGVVLGIDPGASYCGWGVLRNGQHLAHGMFTVQASGLAAMADKRARVEEFETDFLELARKVKPDIVAVEMYTARHDIRGGSMAGETTKDLIQAVRTLCRHVLGGVTVVEIVTTSAKRAVLGSCSADKADVQEAVAARLGLPGRIAWTHAADALAVAIACTERRRGRR